MPSWTMVAYGIKLNEIIFVDEFLVAAQAERHFTCLGVLLVFDGYVLDLHRFGRPWILFPKRRKAGLAAKSCLRGSFVEPTQSQLNNPIMAHYHSLLSLIWYCSEMEWMSVNKYLIIGIKSYLTVNRVFIVAISSCLGYWCVSRDPFSHARLVTTESDGTQTRSLFRLGPRSACHVTTHGRYYRCQFDVNPLNFVFRTCQCLSQYMLSASHPMSIQMSACMFFEHVRSFARFKWTNAYVT